MASIVAVVGIVDMVALTGMSLMSSPVVLRVMVDESYRARLKVLSACLNMSMGELIQRLSHGSETIEELEGQFLNVPTATTKAKK